MTRCQNSLLELPVKLAALGPHIDYRLLPGQTPDKVQGLANSLQAVAYRLKELVDACKSPQADLLVAEVIDDMRAFRKAGLRMQFWLRGLTGDYGRKNDFNRL